MCIIYLDYGGSIANQMQTHFSVLSYLAHTTRKPRILVVTDHTAAYQRLADGVRSFNVEQFCFSLALRHHCQEIHSAEPYMCHYWGNKEGWNLLQGSFFTRSLMEQHTLEEDMQLIRELDVSSVPYYVRSPIWRKRFLKGIDHIAPLKNLQYLKKTKD